MADNKSTLKIEVISTGIQETSRALSGLGTSAGNTERKIAKLTDALSRLTSVQTSVQTATSSQTATMQAMQQAMGSAAANAQALATHVQQLTNQLGGLTSTTNQSNRALDDKVRRGGVLVTTLKAMASAALAYTGISFAKNIIELGDSWLTLKARLENATGSMNNALAVQEGLFEMAQKYRAPLEEMGRLYSRLAPALRDIGKSGKDTMDMVEGVSLALKLNKASAGEAASVMLQFSQAMAAGRLNGAEFNAVAENAPHIMRAIMEETGKTRGELKKMGAEGTLSVEIIQAALQKALPKWREDFAKMPVTVNDAITRIKNAWLRAMGEMSEDSGLNKGLVDALKVVEDLIPAVRDEMVAAFIAVGKWIEQNRGKLSETWTEVKGLVGDVWQLASALGYVAGEAAGVGEKFNIWSFAIFTIRHTLALLQDGLVLIGAIIMKVGSYIAPFILRPFVQVLSVIETIVNGVSKFFGSLGAVASFIGMEGIGASLKSASEATSAWGTTVTSVKSSLGGVGTTLSDASDKALEMLANGDTAVNRLIEGETKLAEVVKKRNEYQDGALGKPKAAADEKAAKAAQKAVEAHAKEVDNLNNSLKEQIELQDRLKQFGLDYDKLGKGAKERIAIQTELDKLQGRELTKAQALVQSRLQERLALALKLEAMEGLNESTKESIKAEEQRSKQVENTIEAAIKEADEMERKVKTYGMAKGAVEALEVAELEAELTATRQLAGMEKEVAQLEKLIAAKKRLAEATTQYGQLEASKKANEEMEKEWKKTVEKYDDIFREGFSKMLTKGKDGWKSFTESLKNTFKTAVADQLYKMFAQPFVVNVIGQIAGIFGGNSGGAASTIGSLFSGSGGGFGGLMSGISNLSSLYSAFTGNMTTMLGSVIARAGSAFGSAAIQSFGQGVASTSAGVSMAGSGGAAGAGAAFAKAIPVIGWIITGMLKNASLYGQGWDAGNGTMSAFGKYNPVTAPSLALDKVLRAVGLSGKVASIISGSSLIARAFGRKAPEVQSTGIEGAFNAEGFAGSNYADWLAKGGWFRSDKRGTNYSALDQETIDEFSNVFAAIKTQTKDFASTLGLSSDVISGYSKAIRIALGSDVEANKTTIANMFSSIADDLASLTANFAPFAKEGETSSATMMRLANSLAIVNEWMATLRKSSLQASIAGGDAASKLIDIFGGLDAMNAAVGKFYSIYYSESEQMARSTELLQKQFTSMGLTMPTTREQFRQLVLAQDLMTSSGRETYATLIAISEAFAQVTKDTREGLAEAIKLADDAVTAARDNLTNAYERERDALQATKDIFEDFAASLAEFKDSLTMGSLSPMTLAQKYANASFKYNDVVARASAGDVNAIAKFQSVAEEFLQVSQQYNASGNAYVADFNRVMNETALLGDYASTQVDVAAASLEALQNQVEGLITINESVLTVTQAVQQLQAALATRAALPATVDGSHANGLAYVPFDGYTAELHKGERVMTAQENKAYTMNYSQYGRKSDEALCNEIKALREEVRQLKEEQREQTANLIASNYDANERNASTVVAGVDDAVSKSARVESIKPVLN